MNNIPYIDILILAMIAVFIINRLKNTLGKKTGNEHDIANKFSGNKSNLKESSPDKTTRNEALDNKIDLSTEIFHENPSIDKELKKICAIDTKFSVDDFLDGAKKAFEFIIKKYSDENISPLKNLLSGGIFKMFDSQIKSRAKKKKTLMLILLVLKKPKLQKQF